MLIVKIFSNGGFATNTQMHELTSLMTQAITSITELKLNLNDISVFTIPNVTYVLRDELELVIEVTGLFKKPERTGLVRAHLAEELLDASIRWAKYHGIPCTLVEIFIYQFDPEADTFLSYHEKREKLVQT